MADPVDARARAITHWIVVFLPSCHAYAVARHFDDGGETRAADEAVGHAYSELESELMEDAEKGGTPIDELEVLVFERGTEVARFMSQINFKPFPVSAPSDWRADA